MAKIREPKNLADYTTIERAADGLEAMVRMLRRHGGQGCLVRWSIQFGFWNPAWNEPGFSGGHIVRTASFHNTARPAYELRGERAK
jgi:hypothetical protein